MQRAYVFFVGDFLKQRRQTVRATANLSPVLIHLLQAHKTHAM